MSSMTRERSVKLDTRHAGLVTIIGGLVGAAAGVFLLLRTPVVGEDMWSFPQSPAEFAVTQLVFALSHLAMVWGLSTLGRSDAVPASRLGRTGTWLAIIGMAALTINELVAIVPMSERVDSPMVGAVGAAYGVITLVLAVGLVVLGVAMGRGGGWTGPERWLPLLIGIWLLVPCMPALMLSFTAARISLTIWALLFAWLGWAMARRS